jgi:tight adherence protein B
MLVEQLPLTVVRGLVVVLAGGGGALLVVAFVWSRAEELRRWLADYKQRVATQLAFLRIRLEADAVVHVQAVLLVLTVLLVVSRSYLSASVLLTLSLVPLPFLQHQSLKRITRIEAQLDSWLYSLASSLRATPALGEAIAASVLLVQAPLREELELLLKEQKLGTSIEEGLGRMASRIASGTVQSAMASLRIGLRTGGQLSDILERSAQALREMARLEGVVRTKTAEGKAQTFVVGVLPFPMVAMIQNMDPDFFRPLLGDTRGHLLIAAAVVLWVLAIVLARRFVRVDI